MSTDEKTQDSQPQQKNPKLETAKAKLKAGWKITKEKGKQVRHFSHPNSTKQKRNWKIFSPYFFIF